MKRKLISVSLALALGLSLAACGSKPAPSGAETPAGELGTLSGPVELQFWHSISNQNHLKVLEGLVEEFNETIGAEKGITVVPTFNGSSSELYSSVVGAIKAGSAPDVTLALRPYVADYLQTDYVVNLEPYITDPNVGMTDYEDIFEGLREANSSYAKEGIYSLPIHSYSEVLYYNKTFFAEHGLSVPTTWDEMWELGEKAKAEGTYLFTYPTTGYFDAFFYALMYAAGGPEFFNKATHYEEGIWDTPEAKTCFDIVTKLASYTNPITPAQANDQDFTQNQQLVLDNKALFMPNGTWIVGEMAEAPRADGFEWGMTALPAVKAGGDSYSYTWFEQAWIPAGAEHLDAAKQFVAYLYSDEACKLFAESGAIQPVLGIADDLDGDNKMFYSIYDNGAKAAMGNFAAFSAIPGVEVRTVFFDPVNSLVSGSMTEQQWIDGIKSASDQMRANIIE